MNDPERACPQPDLPAQVKALQDKLKEVADALVEEADALVEMYNDWEDSVRQPKQGNKVIFEDGDAYTWATLLAYFLLGVAAGGCVVYWWHSL